MHKVLKNFDYSHDGVSVVALKEGDVLAFRDDLVDGLVAAGLIGPAPKGEPKSNGKTTGGEGV